MVGLGLLRDSAGWSVAVFARRFVVVALVIVPVKVLVLAARRGLAEEAAGQGLALGRQPGDRGGEVGVGQRYGVARCAERGLLCLTGVIRAAGRRSSDVSAACAGRRIA